MAEQVANSTDDQVQDLTPSWRRAASEVLLLLTVLVVFSWLHTHVGHARSAATAQAHDIQSLERTLHLNLELPASAWLAHNHALIVVASRAIACTTSPGGRACVDIAPVPTCPGHHI